MCVSHIDKPTSHQVNRVMDLLHGRLCDMLVKSYLHSNTDIRVWFVSLSGDHNTLTIDRIYDSTDSRECYH